MRAPDADGGVASAHVILYSVLLYALACVLHHVALEPRYEFDVFPAIVVVVRARTPRLALIDSHPAHDRAVPRAAPKSRCMRAMAWLNPQRRGGPGLAAAAAAHGARATTFRAPRAAFGRRVIKAVLFST